MNVDLMFSSKKQDWETPQHLFDELDKEFQFETDVCANYINAKCEKYVDEKIDALKIEWNDLGTVFCNPPYETGLQNKIVKKAWEQHQKYGNTIVMLIPARTDTARWHDYIFGKAEVRFLRGRLKFETQGVPHKNAAPFPSAIIIYRR